MSPLLLFPSTCKEILENIKRAMEQHPQLALPNKLNKYIQSYSELYQKNPIVFDDHMVVLQGPVVDKSLIMNVFKN